MYTALADVYDLFAPDDASARADVYRNVLPLGEGVDIGCGTGALTLELYKRGYRVYGVDPSPQMLRMATERAVAAGAVIRFVRGAATDTLTMHPLDFAFAANDVFNYEPHMSAAFANVYASLKTGGVFAFDISSEYKLKNVLAGNTFSESKEDITYIWQNFRRGNKLCIEFTVFSPEGKSYIKTSETQVQYIRSQAAVRDALYAAGFTDVHAYAFGSARAPREKTERILFTAKK